MPKSKYAPALFEVIQREQDAPRPGKLQVPKWWRTNPLAAAEPASPEPAETAETHAAAVPEIAPRANFEPSPSASTYREEPVSREPMEAFMRVSVGDKTLVMSTLGATVVIGVLFVGLVATFELGSVWGRWGTKPQTASLSSPDEVELAVAQLPKPEVLKVTQSPVAKPVAKPAETAKAASPKPAPAPPAAKTTPPAPAADSAKKTEPSAHVVLETFSGDHKESAEFAQKWLKNKKIDTLLEKKGNRWRLVSAEGFDNSRSEDAQHAQNFIEGAKALGKAMSSDMVHAGLPNYLMSKPALERIGSSSP